MSSDPRQGTPADLAFRFLRQLKESGEDELLLSTDTASLVTGRRSAQAAPARTQQSAQPTSRSAPVATAAGAPVESPVNATASPSDSVRADAVPPDSVRAKAAALPEPEIIEVRLALGATDGGERDMFVERSQVDRCKGLECVSKLAAVCEACELASTRTNVVFGTGSATANLMFIGEGPGANEDLEGVPFVGRAGELLNKILDAAEFKRDEVYIANIIKCRPPNNRTPMTNEIEACVPFLAKQIALIKPRIICTLGLPATQTLLGMKGSMGSLRGKMYRHRDIRVIPTYHPAAALRDPKYKRPMWEDFLLIRREYDRG